MTTVTLGLPCNCPTYIQPNTFCNFSFTYQSSAIFNSLEWSGQMVYQLANGQCVWDMDGGLCTSPQGLQMWWLQRYWFNWFVTKYCLSTHWQVKPKLCFQSTA